VELLVARVALLLLVMVLASLIFSVLMVPLVEPNNITLVLLGMFLVGFAGICLGTLIGVTFNRELEASLTIIAFVGCEVALGMQSSDLARYLPFYYPIEIVKTGAFTDSVNVLPFIGLAFLYSLVNLAISFVVWSCKIQI
jgi:hypothetical protein